MAEPLNGDQIRTLNILAARIARDFNEGDNPQRVGFALIAVPFGKGLGKASFVSNLSKPYLLKMLRDMTKHLEADNRG